ncbi:MAG: FAD-dependent oxidoreductase [Bacteroidota bacterium]|nr:FAD-dependent oxidoreductase [Bacteroidota bacterium]
MKLPFIIIVDDDEQVLHAIRRDMRARYNAEYKIISTTSANEALDALAELKNSSDTVALFLVDQRMPEMEGVDFLQKALKIYPDAKRMLLTAYSDTVAAIKAINVVQLDYYLTKPWYPAEEKLYPVIDDLLGDWQGHYTPDFKGIKIVGYQFSPLSHEIKDYLAGNLIPYLWFDFETNPEAKTLVEVNNLGIEDLPLVIYEDGICMAKPTIRSIAEKTGLTTQIKNEVYDVVIIGAGPAGLAASVYGSSEGLKTLLIERRAPGGQAGTSSRIENYLGFPAGLSGADLTRRAISQAQRLGAEFLLPRSVCGIKLKDGYKIIVLSDGQEIVSRSVVITSGVDYRKLEAKGIEDFTGAGVYYGAARTEASYFREKDVFIIGGGNSAGQAALHMSKFARKVYIVIRRDSLIATMSAYLINEISLSPNIEVLTNTEIIEASGNTFLENLTVINTNTQEKTNYAASALYIFIGARPYTEWIRPDIIKDSKGFIETGRNLTTYDSFAKIWKSNRDPYLLETSCPGIFAAGDVRSGAMNRVASAVGEGSMAISFVHKYLQEM